MLAAKTTAGLAATPVHLLVGLGNLIHAFGMLMIIAFTLGVCLLQQQAQLPPLAWGTLFALAVLAGGLAANAPSRGMRVAALLCAVLCGWCWAGWRADLRLQDQLASHLEGEDLPLIGVVAALVQHSERGQRFEFAVEQTLTVADGVPSRLLLSDYASDGAAVGASRQFRAGERWQLTVRLKRPQGFANPGSMDYEAWLFERGLRATGYVRPGPAQRLQARVARPDYWLEQWREQIRSRMQAHLPAEEYPWAGILLALAIGDQRSIAAAEWQVFNRTGTTHLMSISGLHVTLVAALIGSLVAAAWRRQPVWVASWPAQRVGMLAAALTGLAYALLAGFSVPAQRTAYMLLVAVLASLSGRRLAPARVLALALLVVVLWDPWAVLAPGFWLSFGAAAALFWIAHAIPAAGHWRAHLAGWGRVQWAATLASLPVLLLVFQQFSLVSPLTNALAIPVVSWLVTPLALLGAATTLAWPLHWAHALLSALLAFLQAAAGWPTWQAPAPPLWVAGLAALGVSCLLLPRGLPGRWLGLGLLLPALHWPPSRPPPGAAWIEVLDVGQGLAVVVRTANHLLLYDPGPLYGGDSEAGTRVVLPFLRFLGVDRIDHLVISHRDSDHAGAAPAVRAALPIGRESRSYAAPLAERCRAGEHWQWDGVEFSFLHPAASAYDTQPPLKANHLSCVLRISSGARAVLLTADIEAADEAQLLAQAASALPAEVLLVPHHGSKTSSTPAFIAAVAPAHAIFPVGYRNRFGHPHPAVDARYLTQGIRRWRTDQSGALSVHLAASGVTVSAWRALAGRYWQRQ